MVLLGRIELPTSALPRMRSTTELQQHTISARAGAWKPPGEAALLAARARLVNRADAAGLLHAPAWRGREAGMACDGELTREERLAAKLRENLRRRKAQARALDGSGAGGRSAQAPANESGETLPKAPPSR
jgi:hypothetical protein